MNVQFQQSLIFTSECLNTHTIYMCIMTIHTVDNVVERNHG